MSLRIFKFSPAAAAIIIITTVIIIIIITEIPVGYIPQCNEI